MIINTASIVYQGLLNSNSQFSSNEINRYFDGDRKISVLIVPQSIEIVLFSFVFFVEIIIDETLKSKKLSYDYYLSVWFVYYLI